LAIGTNHARYGKTKLVPFGEYLPLSKYLRGIINLFTIPMSDFISAASQQNAFNFKDYVLLPLICYEIAYPEFVRSKMQHASANALVTISEDGWFGDSWGPHQHLNIARMRAIETGRYVLRATTNGISAIINTQGKVLAQSPQFKKYILTSKFYSYTNSTPWVRFGGYPWLLLLCILNLLTLRICSVKNHQ
jgi:apolipoprotein N-acyltransferase